MTQDTREAEILSEVSGFLQQVIGEQWVSEIEIGMNTTFSTDLELESIEFVSLAEKLQERYGDAIDFPGWFSTMELDDLINLSVGRLVEHIAAVQKAG
jgi:acyl carrier protein